MDKRYRIELGFKEFCLKRVTRGCLDCGYGFDIKKIVPNLIMEELANVQPMNEHLLDPWFNKCSLCKGYGEIVIRPKRTIGYTIANSDEMIDEHLIKCPECKGGKNGQ